jgi:hypothetical protein
MAALAIPVIIEVAPVVYAAAGVAVAGLVALFATRKRQRDRERAGADAAARVNRSDPNCPPHQWSNDVDYIARNLGLDRRTVGMAIHAVKEKGLPVGGNRVRRNPDINICAKCGECEFEGRSIGNIS